MEKLQIVNKIESENQEVDLKNFSVHCFIQSGEGMLKEAFLEDVNSSRWKVYSDEGPYLNAKDTAPSPLAYFSAGMAFAFAEQIQAVAREKNISVENYRVMIDSYYSIKGSALQRTLISSGMPVEVKVELKTDASEEEVGLLLAKAKRRNAVFDYIDGIMVNEFSLYHNGKEILDHDLMHHTDTYHFDAKDYVKESNVESHFLKKIILKQEKVKSLHNVEGGVGAGMKESQARLLHIRAVCKPYENGIAQTEVQIFRPLGSTYRFLCDISGMQNKNLRTPSPLAYASLGIGFCLLTQINRYAKIKNFDLKKYAIDQSTSFIMEEDDADVLPIKTAAYIQSDLTDEIAKDIIHMSEQTCFLHGTMRGIHEVYSSVALVK